MRKTMGYFWAAVILMGVGWIGPVGAQAPKSQGPEVVEVESGDDQPFRITIVSPKEGAAPRTREELQVRGEVRVNPQGKGPQSITVKIEKGKGKEFASFALVPQRRENPYEFEAMLRAPQKKGVYDLYCIGIISAEGGRGKGKVTKYKSNVIKLKVHD